MASKLTLVLLFNILFFTLVSSNYVPCPPPPAKNHRKKYPPAPHHMATCPRDTLKLRVCANVLNLANVVVGPKHECCALIQDLVDLDAAVCLCTALRANVLGINLNIPVSLSVVLNRCGKKVPSGFQCA